MGYAEFLNPLGNTDTGTDHGRFVPHLSFPPPSHPMLHREEETKCVQQILMGMNKDEGNY